MAVALEKAEELKYFSELQTMYQNKRNKLQSILDKHGLPPIVTEGIIIIVSLSLLIVFLGSYFMLADVSKINEKAYMDPKDASTKDYQFCRWLTRGQSSFLSFPFFFFSLFPLFRFLVSFLFFVFFVFFVFVFSFPLSSLHFLQCY